MKNGKLKFGVLAVSIIAMLLMISSAYANIARDGQLLADCDGYTVWVTGEHFEPGDVITVDYYFLLQYQGPDPDGSDVSVHGQIVLTDHPEDPFEASKSVTWEEELGSALPCGDYVLIHGSGVPATRIEWQDEMGGTHRDHMTERGDWDGTLSCPCDHVTAICRTPGFWGTHAGTEKRRSRNLTQEVLDEVGSLNICGEIVDNTSLNTAGSAEESICVSPRGNQRLQLARQLTAAALNCAMTDGDPGCAGVGIGPAFAECDMACANGWSDEYSDCISRIDCFNNGGVMLDNGMCQIGTCAGDGVTPCDEDETCGLDDEGMPIECVPTAGNCHEQPLISEALGLDFEPPGPAGSPKACTKAKKTGCTLFDCP